MNVGIKSSLSSSNYRKCFSKNVFSTDMLLNFLITSVVVSLNVSRKTDLLH